MLPIRREQSVSIDHMEEFDLYDVLAELGYGMLPRTRLDRAAAFGYKHAAWLDGMPDAGRKTIEALAGQFAEGGTESLESIQVFQMPEVAQAGGLAALKALGSPAEALRETKERMFSA
jgi:type I restriction enzyme R subunit